MQEIVYKFYSEDTTNRIHVEEERVHHMDLANLHSRAAFSGCGLVRVSQTETQQNIKARLCLT